MLIHEWTRYRDKQERREDQQVASEDARMEVERVEAAPETANAEAAESEKPAPEPATETPAPVSAVAPRRAPSARSAASPARLVASDFQSRRLQALLARQQRLPLEVTESKSKRTSRRPAETREEMIQRLLDPVLTIHEAAALLGVCPTSVRRYTNRGVLKCFRTPGNQRRFRLSDVLDFMERQQESLE